MFVVDTNILVYATNPDGDQYPVAREALEEWRAEAESWFVTWPILFEYLRVSTLRGLFEHPRTLQQAWAFVAALLATPSIGILTPTERHARVVAELVAEYPSLSGSILHDFHTVALMREHGIGEIRTADGDFRRFEHLRVSNPLAP